MRAESLLAAKIYGIYVAAALCVSVSGLIYKIYKIYKCYKCYKIYKCPVQFYLCWNGEATLLDANWELRSHSLCCSQLLFRVQI